MTLWIVALLAALAAPATPGVTPPSPSATWPDDGIHADYDRLLKTYVQPNGVRYAAWKASQADRLALAGYVHGLERFDPKGWPRDNALAFWINLYNAATLHLILQHYPLGSIKDLRSPWDTPVATVGGRALSLNDIENKIIRPTFDDPRVHFALNCASVSCPPLRPGAYAADSLNRQLNDACRGALNSPRYLSIEGRTIRHTKIFQWYAGDFHPDAMAVREFMARYVPDHVARKLTEPTYKLASLPYDWKLNEATADSGAGK